MKIIHYLLTILLTTFPLLADAKHAISCHPAIQQNLPQYIVGYGSLIEPYSRRATYPQSGVAIPITLTGFKRGWFAQGPRVGSHTYLGVVAHPAQQINAVLFQVHNRQAIDLYDARESLYCRVAVAPQNIRVLSAQKLPRGEYWLYVVPKHYQHLASAAHPILQSYVDIFLAGCFTMQNKYQLKNFAENCVRTTHDWPLYWIKDRAHAQRKDRGPTDINRIDELLVNNVPFYFQ